MMITRGGDFREQGFQPSQCRLRQPAAVFTSGICLPQNSRGRIRGNSPDGVRFGDSDPHLEVGGLLDEDMFLRGKQPEQIAAPDLVFAVGEQVEAAALRDEVKFQFGVMVHRVGAALLVVVPEVAIEFGRQMEVLAHDDKK